MFEDEIKLTDENRPHCPACAIGMKCPDCEDMRPTAGDLYDGWRLQTPLGRWETVTKVVTPRYARIGIYTRESGDVPWRYWEGDHVNAVRPQDNQHGDPEVRMVENTGRDAGMYLVATLSTYAFASPVGTAELGHARYDRAYRCWVISRDGDDPLDAQNALIQITVTSKDKARTELRKIGKDYAKRLGVKFREEGKRS